MDLKDGATSPASPEISEPKAPVKEEKRENDGKSHVRSKSGGFLGGLSFLKLKDSVMKSQNIEGDKPGGSDDVEGSTTTGSIATALRQSQGRQRKGSLRQAAMAKFRERSGSLRKERGAPIITTTMSADSPHHDTVAHDTSTSINSSSDREHLSLGGRREIIQTKGQQTQQLLESPITSPVGLYASTTDEDDHVSFYRPSSSSGTSSFTVSSQGPAMSLLRRRSNRGEQRIPTSAVPTTPEMDLDEEWDYSETEWWGWVVLIATWVVFVVGMGSCLGVWSWAWDVGETPYAPPDLEDDDTLPITGYYPALMVCTAVMAWVWVVVAWVGMKYFRHAKVGVDG